MCICRSQMIPSSTCSWKCPLQLVKSLWRASLFVWLLCALTFSHLGNISTLPLWFGVGNSLGKLEFYPRKDPRLNNVNDPVPPVYSWPIPFPEWRHQPHLSRRSPCSPPGALGALFNHPNLAGIQVHKDHSFTCLYLFNRKDAPEPCEEGSLLLKKQKTKKKWKRDRKTMTISYICSILYGLQASFLVILSTVLWNKQTIIDMTLLNKKTKAQKRKYISKKWKQELYKVHLSFHAILINHASKGFFPRKLSPWHLPAPLIGKCCHLKRRQEPFPVIFC